MNTKNIGYVMILSLLVGLGSCKKADTYYYEYDHEVQEYDGTILDYLQENRAVYDSMLVSLDMVPDLRAFLGDPSTEATLFAMNNRSYELAIDAMNENRRISQREPLYLEDLDRVFVDSILCRYIFEGLYDTRALSVYEEGLGVDSYKYGYEMNLNYVVSPASGFVGGGQGQIVLSDVNNSIFHRYWQSSRSSVVNIKTSNGYIHVLSQGHNFGFNKLISEYN